MLLAAVAAAIVLPAVAEARKGCESRSCQERIARKQCSNANPKACIRRAILTYRLNSGQAAWMWRVARCESGMRPLAYYPSLIAETEGEQRAVDRAGTSAGLYGYIYSTWKRTRYGDRSRWVAKWAALAAASFVRAGRAHEWECK